jgi:hypothetical protein
MSVTTIMDFKATMSKGFARPNLFKVEISKIKADKQPLYQMSCFQAQIPGHNIATTDKDIGFRSIAYQKIFSDVILGFYVDADLNQLKFWQDWIDTIINKRTNHHNYYNKYVGTVKVTQQNRSGVDVATWTLHDAYPKQVDPIQLDYGTNDAVMTCNATITYRYFDVVWHTVAKKETKEAPAIYAHNVRTDLNKTNPMTEIQKERWKFGWTQQSEIEFMKGHGNWDTYSRAEQISALKAAGFDPGHGDSSRGGAFHMVTTKEEDE